MPYPYVTPVEFEYRIGQANYRRLFDDNADGIADAEAGADATSVVLELLKDASAKVAGHLRTNYVLEDVAADTPREVKRLTLDVATAMAARRHPEVMALDWVELDKACNAELKMLSSGKTRLDVTGTPEPAANSGGTYIPDPIFADGRTFADGFGDF